MRGVQSTSSVSQDEQQSSFLNLAISLMEFMQTSCTLSAYKQLFYQMYVHVDIQKKILNKNKNIFEKMSGYVGFLPPPTYFLHTLLGLLHSIVNDHSVYVGSMWVGVRILHILHSFFRKCFYSCIVLQSHPGSRAVSYAVLFCMLNSSVDSTQHQ